MRTSIKYLLLGAGFGGIFPLVSTLVMIESHGIAMGWGQFWEIQANEPLLWVIDTAPLFLGLFAWMAGIRQEKLEMINRTNSNSLERSLIEMDQFAYVVSHDLKAPLRGIYSLADFIDEDLEAGDREAVKGHLNLLRKRVDRMQNLIMGVLEYSRAGKDLDAHSSIDLNVFLPGAVENMSLPDGFVVDFPTDMPTVRFNAIKLLQIFQNLLSNAAKHNNNPAGRAELACHTLPDQWEFSVTDNGPGIPAQFHEQVFTIFRTLKSRDVVESTGIGLPIVKKIVEEAGGSIYIDKDYQKGARVVFSILRA